MLSIDRTWTDRGCAILELTGDLDLHGINTLREALDHVATRPPRIVLEMTAVKSIDETGIKLLLGAWKSASATGGGVALVGCAAQVQSKVRHTGAAALLLVCTSLEEAFDRLRQPAPQPVDAG